MAAIAEPLLDRGNLSDDLRALIRRMIVDQELGPDTRINEVHLAKRLGVSRTPLREALAGLVSEGALVRIPRRGVFVRPLTEAEFREIYPMRGLLDPEALRLSGIPSPARLRRLREINHALQNERDIEKCIELDDAWHLELVANCPNSVLVDLIRQFILRTRRYELAYYRSRRNRASVFEEHEAVLRAVETGDLDAAIAALKVNLTSGVEPICQWLRQLERRGDKP